jgi:adenylate kinase
MTTLLIGPPGSGKGTQGEILRSHKGFVHLSTGEMMRREVQSATPLGKKLHQYLQTGKLVDDETTIELLVHNMAGLGPNERVVMDGFPRTKKQAERFQPILERLGRDIDQVIELWVPEADAVKRMKLRARHDDTDEAIEVRIQEYEKQTKPLLGYYRSHGHLVSRIDGRPDIETVAKEVEKVLAHD